MPASIPQKQEDVTSRNIQGVKGNLHGPSYHAKLLVVVGLANIEKAMNPDNNFSFTLMAESREDSEPSTKRNDRSKTEDKFDDIVYTFKDGQITGALKIQAKHKLHPLSCKRTYQDVDDKEAAEQQSAAPKLILRDFIADFNKHFSIELYFKSFLAHGKQTSETYLEGLILCTNADLDDDAKVLWTPVDAAAIGYSTTSLDFHISTLFASLGGKIYQLKTHYKRAALVRLLINAIKSKNGMITGKTNFFKEYRAAILHIVDVESFSNERGHQLCKFTNSFLDSSCSNSNPGYNEFIKEFEEQYRQDFNIDGDVSEHLKHNNRIYVSKDFLNQSPTKTSLLSNPIPFPDENVDESFKSFCGQFRLVCGTRDFLGLNQVIKEQWRKLNSPFEDNLLEDDHQKGTNFVESEIASDYLIKTLFDWLTDPASKKQLNLNDIKQYLANVKSNLAYTKMKGASDNLRKENMRSPFRIDHDILNASDLYDQIENEKLLKLEAYDMQFCSTILSDILSLRRKDLSFLFFLKDSDFVSLASNVEDVLRTNKDHIYLILTCSNGLKTVQSIIGKWKRDFLKNSSKQLFLVEKSDKIPTDTSCFRISDLTAESREQFRNQNIPLYSTTISADKVFQSDFDELSIEEVIKVLDEGQKMVENNEIVKKYLEIKPTYVPRCWIDQEKHFKSENLKSWDRDEMSALLKEMHERNRQNISFNEMTESIKKHPKFYKIFMDAIDAGNEFIPIVDDKNKKILILLAEAGCGKSTNLTWLAWHLRKENPSWLVVRCNLSAYCTEFKSFTQDEKNVTGKVIDENVALKMFYKLVHLSLQIERETAEKCSECLFLSDGKVNVSDKLMKLHGLSLNNKLRLLVFKEKFNAGDLVLLLDGFDEIAPHYKEVVLILISRFEKFNALKKLFLTSRPYGFKEQFKQSFENLLFFQLKPLSLQEKGSLLYRIMTHNGNNDNEEESDFYKALCFVLLCHLDDMSDVPLNLMMIVDIIKGLSDRYVKFYTKTIDMKFFQAIEEMRNASFMVEKFIEMRVQLIYCKFGAKENACDNPILIDEHKQKIEQVKQKHGLVALRNFFSTSELNYILTETETQEAQDYMKKIQEANEKTGIINGIQEGVPMFIHRSFAEYLAACWVVKRQLEGKQEGRIKMSSLESFWEQEGLRRHIDRILAKNHNLHLAIIAEDWKQVENIISSNSEALFERDDGDRTALHLFVFYGDFGCSSFQIDQFLPKSIESDIINCKDKIFGRTAMDYMLHLTVGDWDDNETNGFIYYLLYNGALINEAVLFEHVVANPGRRIVYSTAKYVNHVMRYLSHHGIEYEMPNAYKNIKHFCDKVAQYLINESSVDFGQACDFYTTQSDEQSDFNDDENSSNDKYEMPNAYKNIKHFCDKVAQYLINESSVVFGQACDFYTTQSDEQSDFNDDENSSNDKYEMPNAYKNIKHFCDKLAQYLINESSVDFDQACDFYTTQSDEQSDFNDDENSSNDEYEMPNAFNNIKHFYEKVAQYLINESSFDFDQACDFYTIQKDEQSDFNDDENSSNDNSFLKVIIDEDAVWLLESVIQQLAAQPQITQVNWNKMFVFALEHDSIFVLKYFVERHKCLLNEYTIWKCIVISVNHSYKNEFKWFVDLYFGRIKIKNFQPCSIQDDNKYYSFNFKLKYDAVHELIKNTKWNIPTQNMIDKNILCVLTLCAVMHRPSMVRYLKESCQLNLCAGDVYYLAMIVRRWWIEIQYDDEVNTDEANYECLLSLAPNKSDVETTNILRLALTSEHFEFAECLIERYKNDFYAVDELNGWIFFHLCASGQRWFTEMDFFIDGFDLRYLRYKHGMNQNEKQNSLFRCMLKQASGMDCFGILDKRGRSILYLAFENDQHDIVDMILTHKLGLDRIHEITNLRVDALPNLIFCCREIHKITKSFEKERLKRKTFWILATQLGKLLLIIQEESQDPNNEPLLREEDFIDFYQFAVDFRCLSLMYYLHREFHCAIPPSIRDAGWLVWIAESLESQNIRLFKWGVRQYCQSHLLPHSTEDDNGFIEHDEFNKCNADEYIPPYVNLNELVKRAEVTLTGYMSKEEVCIMQLVVIAICSKNVSAVKYLCETFELKITPTILIDIMVIAHHSYRDKRHGKTFNSIYEYLFERISNLHEIDAEGRNLLHLSVQSGLDCLSMSMIEQNMFNVMDINTQNGWNALHYSVLVTERSRCGDEFFYYLLQNVLQIEWYQYDERDTTEIQRNKLTELCFSSEGREKSVIHVAIEAGNISMARDIIELRLGIRKNKERYEITTADECSRFRECYDVVNQIAAKLPFNPKIEELLNKLARRIERILFDFMIPTTHQNLAVDDVCQKAIKYRSVSALEHLIIAYGKQMNQALAGSTSRELFACMMECIRQNRTNLFKVLLGHYCSLQGIQPCSEDEYEEKAIDFTHKFWVDENKIKWSVVDQEPHDVTMNREYIRLLILSVVHGRPSMTKYLCQMLQLAVDKPLILLIMKVLKDNGYENPKDAAPVYQYLSSRSEGDLNLLHICVEAGNIDMLRYLIKESHVDPNEIGQSVLHLALQNGHKKVAEYIIYHRLGMKDDMKLWNEWDLEKIEEDINVLNQIMESLPANMQTVLDLLDQVRIRKATLTTYYQLFRSQAGS